MDKAQRFGAKFALLAREYGVAWASRYALVRLKSRSSAPQPAKIEDWLSYYQGRTELPARPANGAPKVSILVLTYNNLILNQICLKSIYCNTTYPNVEIVVVDNASADETPAWLQGFAKTHPNLKLILNADNKGFAAGNNQAAGEATGEYLIFLNNDTVVPRGWIERMLNHVRKDANIGLIGPSTNSTGNEARIPVTYSNPMEMEAFAAQRAHDLDGVCFDIRMLAFFCVLARKDRYEAIGGLDERFKVGMFEDDDLAVRYHNEGMRVVCADDAFVHHFQGASFGKLDNERYQAIFEENRRKYEEKWGRKWEMYKWR